VIILAIESSCDETAVAIVDYRDAAAAGGETAAFRGGPPVGKILANIVRSQWHDHAEFGGVVPEIAARAHCEVVDTLVEAAFTGAALDLKDIDAFAATAGPGLIGGLIVGTVSAKALALATGKPYIAVNHLEGHALTVGLTDGIRPPYLLLLVSGGHTQLLVVRQPGDYLRLGSTIDDALGEAFDKTAKLLGLPQPGGPAVERAAASGNPLRFAFPRPMKGRPVPNFSFAGLKTAVRRQALAMAPLTDTDVADLCASFQQAVAESLADRVEQAYSVTEQQLGSTGLPLVVAGGVAANEKLRTTLQQTARDRGVPCHCPPLALCGDNAAMIAWAAAERLAAGGADPLSAPVRPRWPLDSQASPVIGGGAKGAKA